MRGGLGASTSATSTSSCNYDSPADHKDYLPPAGSCRRQTRTYGPAPPPAQPGKAARAFSITPSGANTVAHFAEHPPKPAEGATGPRRAVRSVRRAGSSRPPHCPMYCPSLLVHLPAGCPTPRGQLPKAAHGPSATAARLLLLLGVGQLGRPNPNCPGSTDSGLIGKPGQRRKPSSRSSPPSWRPSRRARGATADRARARRGPGPAHRRRDRRAAISSRTGSRNRLRHRNRTARCPREF